MKALASPNFSRRRCGAAFTLIELLLVLALLALAGALLWPATGALLRRGEALSATDLVAEVCQTVRREAVLTGQETTLSFDAEKQRFVWTGATEGSRENAGPALRIDLLHPTVAGAVLLGGRLIETSARPSLTFFPDGTCEPVRVQVRQDGRAEQVLAIDPWTCAPGLEVKS